MASELGRRSVVGAALALGAGLPVRRAAAAERTLRVGYQKYGTLIILKGRGTLERALAPLGWGVSWHEFAFGPPLLEAMNAGSLDFGTAGETPPIFAQAARAGVLYVGHEPPAPRGEAVVVPANSAITGLAGGLAGLKGRRVGVARGSNAHYLLVRALDSVGLSMRDITPAYLAPADALAALRGGELDAWSIWDPYLAAAEVADKVRVLRDGDGLVDNHQFYLAARDFATANAPVLQAVLREIAALDGWAAAHKAEVAAELAPATGLPLDVVRSALERLSYGTRAMTPETTAAQQRIADTLRDARLIPGGVRVADVVWTPPGG